jgi:Site-specific recombinase XerD
VVHGITEALKSKKRKVINKPLWPYSRMTGFRYIKSIMDEAGIADGAHKCPKGLRHGFGVHALGSGVPLNMLSKWLGHSSLETTAIYANALGEEQRDIAARMWT